MTSTFEKWISANTMQFVINHFLFVIMYVKSMQKKKKTPKKPLLMSTFKKWVVNIHLPYLIMFYSWNSYLKGKWQDSCTWETELIQTTSLGSRQNWTGVNLFDTDDIKTGIPIKLIATWRLIFHFIPAVESEMPRTLTYESYALWDAHTTVQDRWRLRGTFFSEDFDMTTT